MEKTTTSSVPGSPVFDTEFASKSSPISNTDENETKMEVEKETKTQSSSLSLALSPPSSSPLSSNHTSSSTFESTCKIIEGDNSDCVRNNGTDKNDCDDNNNNIVDDNDTENESNLYNKGCNDNDNGKDGHEIDGSSSKSCCQPTNNNKLTIEKEKEKEENDTYNSNNDDNDRDISDENSSGSNQKNDDDDNKTGHSINKLHNNKTNTEVTTPVDIIVDKGGGIDSCKDIVIDKGKGKNKENNNEEKNEKKKETESETQAQNEKDMGKSKDKTKVLSFVEVSSLCNDGSDKDNNGNITSINNINNTILSSQSSSSIHVSHPPSSSLSPSLESNSPSKVCPTSSSLSPSPSSTSPSSSLPSSPMPPLFTVSPTSSTSVPPSELWCQALSQSPYYQRFNNEGIVYSNDGGNTGNKRKKLGPSPRLSEILRQYRRYLHAMDVIESSVEAKVSYLRRRFASNAILDGDGGNIVAGSADCGISNHSSSSSPSSPLSSSSFLLNRHAHVRIFVSHQCHCRKVGVETYPTHAASVVPKMEYRLRVEGQLLVGHLDHIDAAKKEDEKKKEREREYSLTGTEGRREDRKETVPISTSSSSCPPLSSSYSRDNTGTGTKVESHPISSYSAQHPPVKFTHLFHRVVVVFKAYRIESTNDDSDNNNDNGNGDNNYTSMNHFIVGSERSLVWEKETSDAHAFDFVYEMPSDTINDNSNDNDSNSKIAVVAVIKLHRQRPPGGGEIYYRPSFELCRDLMPSFLPRNNINSNTQALSKAKLLVSLKRKQQKQKNDAESEKDKSEDADDIVKERNHKRRKIGIDNGNVYTSNDKDSIKSGQSNEQDINNHYIENSENCVSSITGQQRRSARLVRVTTPVVTKSSKQNHSTSTVTATATSSPSLSASNDGDEYRHKYNRSIDASDCGAVIPGLPLNNVKIPQILTLGEAVHAVSLYADIWGLRDVRRRPVQPTKDLIVSDNDKERKGLVLAEDGDPSIIGAGGSSENTAGGNVDNAFEVGGGWEGDIIYNDEVLEKLFGTKSMKFSSVGTLLLSNELLQPVDSNIVVCNGIRSNSEFNVKDKRESTCDNNVEISTNKSAGFRSEDDDNGVDRSAPVVVTYVMTKDSVTKDKVEPRIRNNLEAKTVTMGNRKEGPVHNISDEITSGVDNVRIPLPQFLNPPSGLLSPSSNTPSLFMADIPVEIRGLFHDRVKDLLLRFKRREHEYASGRTNARTLEVATGITREQAKINIEDAVRGEAVNSSYINTLLALAKGSLATGGAVSGGGEGNFGENPVVKGGEARVAAHVGARIASLVERLHERSAMAITMGELARTCMGLNGDDHNDGNINRVNG